MTDAEYKKKRLDGCTPGSRTHLESADTDEMRAVFRRIATGVPSVADSLAYIEWELREADESLPPNAPNNGRGNDGWHASCCVERALTDLRRLAKAVA